mmetsp:Transcript_3090/g.6748  ORF Transcript_3090/g.6748 Transcript_3090/m.6748 type:complete len:203 (+) Transcript_3090:403-1011(+)
MQDRHRHLRGLGHPDAGRRGRGGCGRHGGACGAGGRGDAGARGLRDGGDPARIRPRAVPAAVRVQPLGPAAALPPARRAGAGLLRQRAGRHDIPAQGALDARPAQPPPPRARDLRRDAGGALLGLHGGLPGDGPAQDEALHGERRRPRHGAGALHGPQPPQRRLRKEVSVAVGAVRQPGGGGIRVARGAGAHRCLPQALRVG